MLSQGTVAITKTASGNQDIWLLDLSRQVLRRFTSDDAPDANAVWSPDGRRVAFTSSRTGGGTMYVAAVSGDEPEDRLVDTPPAMQASDWSRDGRYLLFRSQSPTTRYDIWAVAPDEGKKAFPVVQTAFDERDAQFSPDGKWIAFESNESGRFEIYVQAFPGPGRKWPISPAGGAQVRWSHDGRELFYIAADRRLMSVPHHPRRCQSARRCGHPEAVVHDERRRGCQRQSAAVHASTRRSAVPDEHREG